MHDESKTVFSSALLSVIQSDNWPVTLWIGNCSCALVLQEVLLVGRGLGGLWSLLGGILEGGFCS